jgi:histidinol-phosphatase (PHP family)
MPEMWILELYASCGGEIITTGSDSHIAEQVGTTAQRAVELLKSAGFKYYTTYQEHTPEFVKLD